MSDDNTPTLVDIGKLAKPVDTLVKKIASAAGMLYAPTHTRRMAKAKADAALIKAQSEINTADLKRRTAVRLMLEEMRNQENMESITEKAIPLLNENADASTIDDDWTANFFDKCRTVSNEEMQQLWAKILAGEVNNPGAFSSRTVSLLADFEKRDAEALALVCSYGVGDGNELPLIFHYAPEIYKIHGRLLWDSMHRLKDLGLLRFSLLGDFYTPANDTDNRIMTVRYFGKEFKFHVPSMQFKSGMVEMTLMAKELAQVSGATEIEDFFEYLQNHFKKNILPS
jgi:Protein of unknown function (DUF2806)